VKQWIVPASNSLEKGKIKPNSMFFSDRTNLRNEKKSKIIKINVWTNTEGIPCIIQFIYDGEKNKGIEGIQLYPTNVLSALELKPIEFKQGDYLAKLTGTFFSGCLESIVFYSKMGKRDAFHELSQGESFKFEPRAN